MSQKPTVGRIVLYRSRTDNNKGQAYPAVITHVWSDSCVNLSIIQDGSYPLPAGEFTHGSCVTSVLQSSDPADLQPRTWIWPPREAPASVPAQEPAANAEPPRMSGQP